MCAHRRVLPAATGSGTGHRLRRRKDDHRTRRAGLPGRWNRSPNLIAHARRRFDSIPFHRVDASSLAYRTASFDAALFSYNGIDCIYPLASRIRCMREVHRVLRAGGAFLLSSHNSIGAAFSGGFFLPAGLLERPEEPRGAARQSTLEGLVPVVLRRRAVPLQRPSGPHSSTA